MKKKIFFIIFLSVCIGLSLWWFLKKENNAPVASQGEIPCVAFQGENPLLPCFKEIFVGSDTKQNTLPSYTVTVEKNEKNEAVYDCFSKNQVESNDCVTQVAYEKQDTSLCSFVVGAYSEAYCKEKISNPKNERVNTSIVDVVPPPLSFSKKETPIPSVAKTNSTFSRPSGSVSSQNEARFSLQGFYDRLKNSPLKLFAFSETQIRPGSELIASGFGFTSTENTVSIGGYEVSGLSSADGMTLSFVVPSGISDGVYDAWVTNSKGTSRNDSQPIRLTITQNPIPRPVITSVSPSLPSYLDSITLYGEHFSGASGLYTSLGVIENISVSDSSIQFRLSDSSLVSKIKDLDYVKGKVIQVLVIVATPQGYNKDTFVFNVQF